VTQLEEYFAGTRRSFSVPLAPAGTVFQNDVWQALHDIPYGDTRTYADIAEAIGRPLAMRAVGNANGANPYAIVVPCHRVVARGGLGGYGGGLACKIGLLELEGAVLP
jgi:methylated-DNA-[protein]-cysteine S-methyltransferase